MRGQNNLKVVVWAASLVGVLLLTVSVVVVALNRQYEVPSDTDLAKLQAQASAAEKARAADRAAELAAIQMEVSWPTDRALRVATNGGSLTSGVGASKDAAAFRSILLSGLREAGPVQTQGVYKSGARLRDSLGQVPSGSDLSIIELGTKDAMKNTSNEFFAEHYGEYLDDVVSASPNTQLICLGLWAHAGAAKTAFLDRVIELECTERDGEFIPLRHLYDAAGHKRMAESKQGAGNLDPYHPNDAGHAAIAHLVLERLALKP